MSELTKTQQKILGLLIEASNKDESIKEFLSKPMTGKTFLFNYIEKYFNKIKLKIDRDVKVIS